MPEAKFRRMFLAMQRQRLYEQVEDPVEEQVLQIFKGKNGLEDICNKEIGEFYELLTLDSVQDEIEGWTVQRGRLECFEEICRIIEESSILDLRNKNQLEYHLEDMISWFA
jgi:hypothetical protein